MISGWSYVLLMVSPSAISSSLSSVRVICQVTSTLIRVVARVTIISRDISRVLVVTWIAVIFRVLIPLRRVTCRGRRSGNRGWGREGRGRARGGVIAVLCCIADSG